MPLSICATTVLGLIATPQIDGNPRDETRRPSFSIEISATWATIEPKDWCMAMPRKWPAGGGWVQLAIVAALSRTARVKVLYSIPRYQAGLV